ncbi:MULTISPECIES: hypothetical protein [unclassified Haloferax]|uniref:hypothetical protein n=1 Tax=unclassified Haloferax TaxID=2625095 RepID=UPI00287701AD|nr:MULTISPECIES: hypothetical protein [unclassified Haloferax]MDS0243763.1 hypothetical protein [Haloferax sp. S2CR25]MDS0446884.1 hypothetical protein [Haloferax sp. S2CR25-2]
MASTAQSLTEPRVLAHTKRRLFPEGLNEGYVVVDTQFSSEQWLASESIDPHIKDELAPFNHVRVGSGYPDLVGVRVLDDEFLAVDRLDDEPPLVAVEAKGYTSHGHVDVERGVIQAYDRLNEANAVYVAAPAKAISQSARTLARELNVGVLGVYTDGDVSTLEAPRLVGNQTTTETNAIRFQASAQGVANKSFGLNHPKNYLAYPLAVYHPEPTEEVLSTHVVRAVDGSQKGAEFLDLIEEYPNQTRLTPLGKEVVRFALREYGSVDAALQTFETWKRSQKRFCDIAPKWGMLTRQVVYAYPATQLLVEEIQRMHEDYIAEPTLPQLIEYLHHLHPSFTIELFIQGTEAVRSRVLNADGELQLSALSDGNVYHSPTVFQLKAMLYHAGILTTRGAEPSNLDPTTDIWALRESIV